MDVWPANMLQPFAVRILDTTSLLMLQLACILEMVESWHKVGALIRVFLCVNRDDDVDTMRKNVKQASGSVKKKKTHCLDLGALKLTLQLL